MGICINYSGRLNDPGQMDEFLEDVRQVSQAFGWRCTEITRQVSGVELRPSWNGKKGQPQRLIESEVRGVYAQPPDTETLQFLFNKKGRLCYYQEMPNHMFSGPVSPDATYFMQFPLSVKTTGALDSHVLILVLLERLKRKFMSKMRIKDDTGFFETGDLNRLALEHATMSMFVGAMKDPAFAKTFLKAAGVIDADAELTPLSTAIQIVEKPGKASAAQVN